VAEHPDLNNAVLRAFGMRAHGDRAASVLVETVRDDAKPLIQSHLLEKKLQRHNVFSPLPPTPA